MLALMQRNIALNPSTESSVKASILDWGTQDDAEVVPPDVILAAECVYFEPAFPLLLETLRQNIGSETSCYFCFKKRRKADLRFMKDAKKMFMVEEIMDDPDRDIWSKQALFMSVS